MKILTSKIALAFLLTSGSFVPCPVYAQGASEASKNISGAPVALSFIVVSIAASKVEAASRGTQDQFASFFSNTNPGQMSVAAITQTSKGVSYLVERASDGLKFTVEVLSTGASKASAVVGSAVSATVIGSGVVLVASGQALAFIPNAIGRALMGSEKVQ